MKYYLFKARYWLDGDRNSPTTIIDAREDEFIAESSDIEKLKSLAKSIPRKGNKTYSEAFQIASVDEHGDIQNYIWSYP